MVEPAADGGATGDGVTGGATGRKWFYGLLPLVLLALLIVLFVRLDPTALFREAFPPLEELTIERVTFPEHGQMRVQLINGGPEAVTVAQVQVDAAFWRFEMEPAATVPRLGRATLSLAYPWVEGEPHHIAVVTSTGLTFAHTVQVATLTPAPSGRYLGTFALLGLYAGVIPVLLGLLWYPFMRRLGTRWVHFFLSLTIGLLAFLVIDAVEEAFEAASGMPESFHDAELIAMGIVGAILGLRLVSSVGKRLRDSGDATGAALAVAYMVAIGIGLHNMGEGLAIGAAYSVGAIALGSFLVIGFAIHNTTEGLAIVAPLGQTRPPLWHLGVMGAIAGLPTILGAWLGGFSYSPIVATLFISIGAGAIIQVMIEIGRMIDRSETGGLLAPLNATGLALGMVLMYATALLVVA